MRRLRQERQPEQKHVQRRQERQPEQKRVQPEQKRVQPERKHVQRTQVLRERPPARPGQRQELQLRGRR